MTSQENKALAENFKEIANKHGFTIRISDNVVKITRIFNPTQFNNKNEWFINCDSVYNYILSFVPVIKTHSSIWGTDGGSVGGMVAMNSGLFTMNISGVKKGFLKELSKSI
jgi:hypothetical protein